MSGFKMLLLLGRGQLLGSCWVRRLCRAAVQGGGESPGGAGQAMAAGGSGPAHR